MANEFNPQNTSGGETRRFDKNLNEDINDFHLPDNEWTQARNAINNSKTGDLGKIGNEPSNLFCTKAPYTIIGVIHLESDKWAIFSTDNIDSEIGYFQEGTCLYKTIVNDKCLNFNKESLVSGVSRETSDCSHIIFWDDHGRNPSRFIDIGDLKKAPYEQPWPNVPYKCENQTTVINGTCTTCVPLDPLQLDCDKLRSAPLYRRPCLVIEKGPLGGELLNGSYFVVVAYTIRQQRITDYFTPSNIQSIFNHEGAGGSLLIKIEDADTEYFSEMEVVVVSIINQQVSARSLGFYSTKQREITLDIINNQLPTVPIEQITIRTSVVDSTDATYSVNDYLIRVGPRSKFDFNYQPLANQIVAKWAAVEYPQEYYRDGGYKTGYMRDEVYSFFIRWIYDTGDVSASYHIPGRPAIIGVDIDPLTNDFYISGGTDSTPETSVGVTPYKWVVENTATITDITQSQLEDGGIVVQKGYMGYWESEEIYPDNNPVVWDSNITVPPYSNTDPEQYNLCGKPIRHHRFPDNDLSDKTMIFDPTNGAQKIRIMGVVFENILPPVDNDGVVIKNLKCFEILRGSRKGNRSVIAKGIINNTVNYDIPDDITDRQGVFPNYPYNDIGGDPFISKTKTNWNGLTCSPNNYNPLTASDYNKDLFTFHSPETNFAKPFLSSRELKVYHDLDGTAEMRYQYPDKHPKHKLLKDLAWLLAGIAGLGAGVLSAMGKTTREYRVAPGATAIPLLSYYTFGGNIALGYTGLGDNSFYSSTILPISTDAVFSHEMTGNSVISPAFNVLFSDITNGLPTFSFYWAEGAEAVLRLIKSAVSYQQYALQQFSHCLYDNSVSEATNSRPNGQRRRVIEDISYLDNQLQDFGNTHRVNNLYRSKSVILKTDNELSPPNVDDDSRRSTRIKDTVNNISQYKDPEFGFKRNSSSYYAAIKQRIRNQYGQINSISQIPVSNCPYCVICPTPSDSYNIISNGTFDANTTGWTSTPSNFWSYNNGLAQTTGQTGVNSFSTIPTVPFVPGEQYTLCFDLVEISPTNQLNVGFISSNPTGQFYFNQPGSYCVNFTANSQYDSLIFSELNSTTGNCPIDLIILFDNSGSVSPSELAYQANFAISVVNSLASKIDSGEIYVGLIEFNTNLPYNAPLSQHSANSIITGLNSFSTSTGGTNIALALCEANNQFQTLGRSNAQKKILLITDGVHNTTDSCSGVPATPPFQTSNPQLQAYCDALKNSGIQITVAGTGDNSEITFATPQWSYIASPNNLFTAIFPDLYTIVSNISYSVDCTKGPTKIDNISIVKYGCAPPPFKTEPIFGGDIYINRYTEKNTFFYFYDWLMGQPDGYEFDYYKYRMLPHPTYWVNTQEFDVMEGITSLITQLQPFNILTNLGGFALGLGGEIVDWISSGFTDPVVVPPSPITNFFNGTVTPSDYHVLDRPAGLWPIGLFGNNAGGTCGPGFVIKYGYFYLFNSGVRDFFVESEYNVAQRDWEDKPDFRHYDYKTYTSLPDLFRTDIIKAGNYFKYDTSLSISKNFYSYVNWGNVQSSDYDPLLSENCYQYRPDRVIYSLPAQFENKRDNWRIFLPNNYKDFLSKVVNIKQINKSGAMIFFDSDSPVQFQGTDQLETDLNTKLTIGDGGLFSQPLQSMVNADRSYEYASCQNSLSIISTPMGVFWISQNQGKIFQLADGIMEISMGSIKWWLAQYLPYQLTKVFPNYTLTDNPVVGIGCQSIYDNENQLVYFTKKDYLPINGVQYDPAIGFYVILQDTDPVIKIPVQLGDPRYFEDASWTLSYDPKIKGWVSYHDWHPNLLIPGKNTFLSIKDDSIWIHNTRCDSYCNYYGIDYPFEVEYEVDTANEITTLRSIEYQLEVYKYKFQNCYDRFHVLDFNFDEAVIYNTEQCSGLLKLNLTPKNNAPAIIQYPIINPTSISILFSKEENRYRFNQFWDITDDRGEFNINAQRTIWNTAANGYIRVLNPNNLNYQKPSFQRKKFRHYTTSVLFRRLVSGDRKMLVLMASNKNLKSPR